MAGEEQVGIIRSGTFQPFGEVLLTALAAIVPVFVSHFAAGLLSGDSNTGIRADRLDALQAVGIEKIVLKQTETVLLSPLQIIDIKI